MWPPPPALRFMLSVLALASYVAAFTPASTAGTDALAANARYNLEQSKNDSSLQCGKHGPSIRKEWSALCPEEKKQWIDAIQCMMRLPSISGDIAPGAKNRFDDFVVRDIHSWPSKVSFTYTLTSQATHINQTLYIHGTGNFLFWHR